MHSPTDIVFFVRGSVFTSQREPDAVMWEMLQNNTSQSESSQRASYSTTFLLSVVHKAASASCLLSHFTRSRRVLPPGCVSPQEVVCWDWTWDVNTHSRSEHGWTICCTHASEADASSLLTSCFQPRLPSQFHHGYLLLLFHFRAEVQDLTGLALDFGLVRARSRRQRVGLISSHTLLWGFSKKENWEVGEFGLASFWKSLLRGKHSRSAGFTHVFMRFRV